MRAHSVGSCLCLLWILCLRLPLFALTPGTQLTPSTVFQETTQTIIDRLNLAGTGSLTPPSANFLSLDYSDLQSFPPFTMGAVGPTQYIACCNGEICTFAKTTGLPDLVMNTTTENLFFNVLDPGTLTSNPRIRYDSGTNRWYIVMNTFVEEVKEPNLILVAASSSSTITPQTLWTSFSFLPGQGSSSPSTYFADFPTLGVDNTSLVIGANVLDVNDDSYQTSDGFVIQKASIISLSPLIYAFRDLMNTTTGTGLQSPQGVDVFDAASTTSYLIGVDRTKVITPAAPQQLMLRAIVPVSGVPNISDNIPITIDDTKLPINVPHRFNAFGTVGELLASDDRLCITHIRNGVLYTAQNIGVDNTGVSTGLISRNACRWYMVDVSNLSSPPLVPIQFGTLYANTVDNDRKQLSYWMPSIITNSLGTMVLGYCSAGANAFINAGYALRVPTDPPGTLPIQALYTASSYSYNPSKEPLTFDGRRWGDYANASVDPSDTSLWLIQEYCNTTDSYGCEVINLRL